MMGPIIPLAPVIPHHLKSLTRLNPFWDLNEAERGGEVEAERGGEV
jgi:hypothetical protein